MTISYIELAATTDTRKQELKHRYFFDCACNVCTDGGVRDVDLGCLSEAVNPLCKAEQQQLTLLRYLDAVCSHMQLCATLPRVLQPKRGRGLQKVRSSMHSTRTQNVCQKPLWELSAPVHAQEAAVMMPWPGGRQ